MRKVTLKLLSLFQAQSVHEEEEDEEEEEEDDELICFRQSLSVP